MRSESKNRSAQLRILVLGYIIRGPMGGMTWHHLQYLLGLQALGHSVLYIEDSGDSEHSCYHPHSGITGADPTYGLQYAATVFQRSGFGDSWAYYDAHTRSWLGPLGSHAVAQANEYDLLINLSCANPVREWFRSIPLRILLDTDPAFTQIRHLTDPARRELALRHNAFFSFAENIGTTRASIPDDGFSWKPTRQPVVLDAWPVVPAPAQPHFSTVMQWESYRALEYAGRSYGVKCQSFADYVDLPRRAGQVFEIAMGSPSAPRKELREQGWRLLNPLGVAADPWSYQEFIQRSKAEFGVAKQGYVTGTTGWFSERSAAYLASGRPVVVQDTGFSDWLETGLGVVTFRSLEEAIEGVRNIDRDYTQHCRKARYLAVEYFDSSKVLSSLLDRALSNGG
jgi:hypothetical protein